MFRNTFRKPITARLLGILLAVTLMTGACFAEGSASDPFFEQFQGFIWSFSSGVGGWSTDLQIFPDGTFKGEFHDSEMGDAAENYPDGTIYYCSFTGRLSLPEQANDNSWKLRVDEVTQEEKEGIESIADGFRYITSAPYGINAGDEVMLYKPGTPLDSFTDSMKMWAHVWDSGDSAATGLEAWFMYNEKADSGFVGLQADPDTAAAADAAGVMPANPWEDVSVPQMREKAGIYFSVPEEAANIICRWYAAEKLGEMQFTWANGNFSFRVQPVALDTNQLADISGMNYTWENEMPVTIGWCPGSIGQARNEAGGWVERCLWYDSAAGLMYSLSVIAPDVDGLDLTAIAEQILLPPEG